MQNSKGAFERYIGFAVLPALSEAVPMIASEELLMRSRTMYAGSFICGIAGRDYTIVTISPKVYADLMNDEKLESIIDHELGHVFCGYLAGIAAKLVSNEINYVFAVYLINTFIVILNLGIYARNVALDKQAAKSAAL